MTSKGAGGDFYTPVLKGRATQYRAEIEGYYYINIKMMQIKLNVVTFARPIIIPVKWNEYFMALFMFLASGLVKKTTSN